MSCHHRLKNHAKFKYIVLIDISAAAFNLCPAPERLVSFGPV